MKKRLGLFIIAMALLGLSGHQAVASDSVESGHNLCVHLSSAKSCQVDAKTRTIKAKLGYSKTDARTACQRVQKYTKAAGGFEKGWQLEIHPGNRSDSKPMAKCPLSESDG